MTWSGAPILVDRCLIRRVARNLDVVTAAIAAILLRTGFTLDIGPVTADKALSELSARVGEKLICSPELEREVLMIHVDDVPWSEVKARLAKVTWAQWRKRQDEWIFERPASLARMQHEAVLAGRAKLLEDEIAKKAKNIPPWSKAYLTETLLQISTAAEKYYRPVDDMERSRSTQMLLGYSGAPAGRALLRILQRLDGKQIAAIRPNSQVLYSDKPTAMEKHLPARMDEILRDFLSEQGDFVRESERRTDLFPATGMLDPRFNMSSSYAPGSRFILTLRRFGSGAVQASLNIVDSEDWHVANASVFLVAPEEAASVPFAEFPKKPLEFSQRALDFESIYMVVSGRYGGELGDKEKAWKLAKEWVPTFCKSDEIEPLGFIVGEGLRKTADTVRANVVADLPDTLLTCMPYSTWDKQLTTDKFVQRITESGRNTTGEFKDGWIEVRPVDPEMASYDRIDRKALATLVRQLDANKMALVDDLADYAVQVPGELCFQSIDEAYATIFSRNQGLTGAGLANYNFADVLRLWGSFTKGQRATLRRGGTFHASDLTELGRFWLTEYVYGIPRVLATNFVTPYTVPVQSDVRRNARSSPYEGMPNGIPSSSTISGDPHKEPSFRILEKDQEPFTEDTSGFGYHFGYDRSPLQGDTSHLISVSYALAPAVKISFDFGGGHTAWTQVGDDATAWSEPDAYSKLPEEMRKKIESAYAEAAVRRTREEERAKGRTIPPR